jgi:hypothetical protein
MSETPKMVSLSSVLEVVEKQCAHYLARQKSARMAGDEEDSEEFAYYAQAMMALEANLKKTFGEP